MSEVEQVSDQDALLGLATVESLSGLGELVKLLLIISCWFDWGKLVVDRRSRLST